MHRLLPLRAAASSSWSGVRPLQSRWLGNTLPRTLICCARPVNPAPFTRPFLTSSLLHRNRCTEEAKEQQEEEEIEDEEDEEAEEEEEKEDREPRVYQPSSAAKPSTLPLKYLLRSDFFSSLLLSSYPNLTTLQYRTHLSPFIRANGNNLHVQHLVGRLVDGSEQEGRRGRKRGKRHSRTKLAREIAAIYAQFVREETGEPQVAERRKVKGGRRKAAGAAEHGQEELEDEEEANEEDDVEDGEERHWDRGKWWRAEKDSAVRSEQSTPRRFQVKAEVIEEEEEDEDSHYRQHRHQQETATASSFLRSKGGRLRYDPSLAFLADLSQPHETFPLARSLNRKIILHTGPTNSGKTHAAMQALQSASTGIYAAPLRLLAWEQYDRMTKRGVKAELVTGQELLTSDDATHTSSTVEMVNVERVVDVAVIDEVQMIGNEERGGSWTRALLGVAARTVHVCGDVSVVELMEDLCSVMGEELQVVSYSRLTPLHVSTPLMSLSNLRRGDCIIAFARRELYTLKHQIETLTHLRCAIIYGSLPPTLRRQQAEQFNAPDGPYDVLVATDAIGMGLNLSVGRIIFSSLVKFDGTQERQLSVRETLQIAGRAGRFAGAFDVGYVTTLTRDTYRELNRLMRSELEPLRLAGLSVSLAQLEALAVHRPQEPLHALLRYMEQFAALDDLYFLADLSQWIAVAQLLRSFPSLTLHERYIFCLSPISADKPQERATLLSFLHQYTSSMAAVPTVSWRPLADWRRLPLLSSTARDLLQLEEAWKDLDVYIWLARRLGEDRFTEREEAEEMRERLSELIAVALSAMSESELRKRRTARKEECRLVSRERKQKKRAARAARAASIVQWTDVDEGADGAVVEVREATIDVVEREVTEAVSASSGMRAARVDLK